MPGYNEVDQNVLRYPLRTHFSPICKDKLLYNVDLWCMQIILLLFLDFNIVG